MSSVRVVSVKFSKRERIGSSPITFAKRLSVYTKTIIRFLFLQNFSVRRAVQDATRADLPLRTFAQRGR